MTARLPEALRQNLIHRLANWMTGGVYFSFDTIIGAMENRIHDLTTANSHFEAGLETVASISLDITSQLEAERAKNKEQRQILDQIAAELTGHIGAMQSGPPTSSALRAIRALTKGPGL